jgi:hypothetical protein
MTVVGRGGARPPILVLVLAAAFVLLVASLMIGALSKPEYPPYHLTQAGPLARPVGDSLIGPALYTLDASSTELWRPFAFRRGAVVSPGEAWDVAFRRFHVIAGPGAGIRDLGEVPFDSVRDVPGDGYLANVADPDTTNPGVGKWYRYSMLSHLLTSKHHVYAVRTADDRHAKLELLAYYCGDVGVACVTFRYAYQGDGSRRVGK